MSRPLIPHPQAFGRKPGPNIWRWRIFNATVALIFTLLAFRIYQVQFIERDQYVQQANENRLGTVSIPATRGIITDRNGVQLAVNVASANATVTPADLPDDPDEEL